MIIHNDRQELQKALQYVEEELKKYNLNRREATMTMLMAEESLVCMMSHTAEQEKKVQDDKVCHPAHEGEKFVVHVKNTVHKKSPFCDKLIDHLTL